MNRTEGTSWLRASLVAIVLIHFVVTLWHASAHTLIPVPLTSLQTAFIGVVIALLPLIGAGLLWTSHERTAAWLIMASMLGSLVFGFINHYMRSSPDYVLEVPAHAWRYSFIVSAALLVVTETTGTVLGAVAMQAWRDEPPTS